MPSSRQLPVIASNSIEIDSYGVEQIGEFAAILGSRFGLLPPGVALAMAACFWESFAARFQTLQCPAARTRPRLSPLPRFPDREVRHDRRNHRLCAVLVLDPTQAQGERGLNAPVRSIEYSPTISIAG